MVEPIYLHAGAHRTGTSSFQLCLAQNLGLLRRLGFDVAYPGRDGVPEGRLRLKLPPPRLGLPKARAFAGRLRAEIARHNRNPTRALILSEENLPGRMFHFYRGALFPGAANRFQALADALDGRPLEILYVLRSYDELYVSAYRKRAEDNPVPPFEELTPKFMAMDRGWPALLGEMRDILQPQRLTVLRHEALTDSCDLLAQLVPRLATEVLLPPAENLNQSATDTALEALQSRYREGEKLSREEWKDVIAAHAEKAGSTGFAAFPATDSTRLKEQYATDLAQIAQMPGLTLI